MDKREQIMYDFMMTFGAFIVTFTLGAGMIMLEAFQIPLPSFMILTLSLMYWIMARNRWQQCEKLKQ